MDYVCEQMSVKEKDYFGLRFVDIARQRVSAIVDIEYAKLNLNSTSNIMLFLLFVHYFFKQHWLDLSKPILKQIKGMYLYRMQHSKEIATKAIYGMT